MQALIYSGGDVVSIRWVCRIASACIPNPENESCKTWDRKDTGLRGESVTWNRKPDIIAFIFDVLRVNTGLNSKNIQPLIFESRTTIHLQ